MSDDKGMYQVTAEAVLATVDTQFGRMKTLMYKGAILPGSTPELRHLLDSKMVAACGDDTSTGLNAEGGLGEATTPTDAPGSVVSPRAATAEEIAEQAKVDAAREAARAKLPSDGSAPDGRASAEVWVEYAVAKGMDRGEAEKAGKDEIRKVLAAGSR